MDKTMTDRIDELEEIVGLLKELRAKTKSDIVWRDFVEEMLAAYTNKKEALEENYFNSPEYLEFAPSYLEARITERPLILRH